MKRQAGRSRDHCAIGGGHKIRNGLCVSSVPVVSAGRRAANRAVSALSNYTLKFAVIVALCLIALLAGYAQAEIVTCSFSGVTTTVRGVPFGMSIPDGTPVSGQFQYDTSAPASSTVGNTSVYPQNISSGLTATFGSFLVSASSYLVRIRNDQPQGGTTVDFFTVQWSSTDNPAPATPLLANGIGQTAGIFNVGLVYTTDPFSDSSLPAALPDSGFMAAPFSFLSEQLAPLDVPYFITSLTPVPEPASWMLGVAGSIVFGIEWSRRRRHNSGG